MKDNNIRLYIMNFFKEKNLLSFNSISMQSWIILNMYELYAYENINYDNLEEKSIK